jgi:hypothetical protein
MIVNSDPRNQADLKALRKLLAQRRLLHLGCCAERVVLGRRTVGLADLFFSPARKASHSLRDAFVHLCLQKRSKSRLMVSELLDIGMQ